jgi:hypothetical protein
MENIGKPREWPFNGEKEKTHELEERDRHRNFIEIVEVQSFVRKGST